MIPFTYVRPQEIAGAISAAQSDRSSFIAGGTGVVDLLQTTAARHELLIDLNFLDLNSIEVTSDRIIIGALVRNSDIMRHPAIKEHGSAVSEALSYSATPQVRNMATASGNLLQRTRCTYFRHPEFNCNRRVPGSGCPAIEGYNREHAILGGSSACIAVHPSDMAVAMVALDAVVRIRGTNGERTVPVAELHRLPEDNPERETVLEQGELITAVEIPLSNLGKGSRYFKVPMGGFSLGSVGVAWELADETIKDIRIALGGVATKPWRSHEAEAVLRGASLTEATFKAAAKAAVQNAVTYQHNDFKVELIQRTIVLALKTMAEGER